MTLNPSGGRAPAIIAPAPANRVELSVEQHLEAVLAAWRTRPPTPKDIQMLEQFHLGAQSIFSGDPSGMGQEVDPETGEPIEQQGAMPGGDAASLRGPEEDYGNDPGAGPVTGY